MENSVLEKIIDLEWQMFSSVLNVGGAAICQSDPTTFEIMRRSQAKTWSTDSLESWYADLEAAHSQGRNLMTEKYAWMMENTFPEEFRKIAHVLIVQDLETLSLVEEIINAHMAWQQAVREKYPFVGDNGRPLSSQEDSPWATSFETYLRGELKSCSPRTVRYIHTHIKHLLAENINAAEVTLLHQVTSYGYASLEDADRRLS